VYNKHSLCLGKFDSIFVSNSMHAALATNLYNKFQVHNCVHRAEEAYTPT